MNGSRDVRVARPICEGRPSETLIDVAAVGICGSVLHYCKDGGIGSAVIHEPCRLFLAPRACKRVLSRVEARLGLIFEAPYAARGGTASAVGAFAEAR
jgi:hypothetical protein